MSGPSRIAITVLVLAGLSGSAAADDGVTVLSSADAKEVAVGDTVRFTVEVRGSGMSGVSPSAPSGMTNLELVGGPSTSTQFSFMNGAVSSSKSFTWLLAPRAAGPARIPPLDVKVGDKIYRTDAVDLDVVPAGSGSRAPARPPARGSGAVDRDPGASEVRIENEVFPERVYVGQPIVVTTRLLTRVQVTDVSEGPTPTLPGFLLEQSEQNLPPERVFREGREYQSFVLLRRILTPTTPGRTTVAAEKRTIRIRATRGDPFMSFFSPATIDIVRSTSPITIEVRAPPQESRPADFSGAVGSFKLQAVADRQEAAVGEGIGLAVTVTGTGNLKTVMDPVFAPNADFRIFDPRIEDKVEGTKPRIYTKTWSYVVTPLSPGAAALPSVSFTYFDPEVAVYRRLVSPAEPLLVKGTEPGLSPGPTFAAPFGREVQALQRDIRFLKTLDGRLLRKSEPLRSRWWIWSVIGLSVAVQPVAWYVARRGGLGALLPGASERQARRRALAEISRVEADGADSAQVSSAAARAVTGFVAARCGVTAGGMTYDAIEDELARRGVGRELRSEVRALLELCDQGRFAPSEQRASGSDGGGDLLERARTLVERLDQEIGRAA